jgi:hypothetical protein
MDIVAVSERIKQSTLPMRKVKLRFRNTGSLPFQIRFTDSCAKPVVESRSGYLVSLSSGELDPQTEIKYEWTTNQDQIVVADKISIALDAITIAPHSESLSEFEVLSPGRPGRYGLHINFNNSELLATMERLTFFRSCP